MGKNTPFCDACGASTYVENTVKVEDSEEVIYVRWCVVCGENKTSNI